MGILSEVSGKVYMVVFFLCICYFGKYFCTTDMYVVKSKFQDAEGVNDIQLSSLFAVGYFWSMWGKIAAGTMCDAIGGKKVIVGGAVAYIAAAFAFSFVPTGGNSYYYFLAVWTVTGFAALGLAWVSIVAVATNWIPTKYLGTIMSFVSMAPQLGDAMARWVLAPFLGYGWRVVFRIAAGIALIQMAPVALFVANSPEEAEPSNKKAAKKEEKSYMEKLIPLLKTPTLWQVSLLSGSLYGTRTLFLLYSNNFLAFSYCREHNGDEAAMDVCVKQQDTLESCAIASSVYTILGCVSVWIVGVLKDVLPAKHRASTLVCMIFPLLVSMGVLWKTGTDIPFGVGCSVVALTGFCLFGPYKILGAVFAVDVGGKEMKSTCTALMGVFDNFFAMAMLIGKGYIGTDWNLMFFWLSLLSAVALAMASKIWLADLNKASGRELDYALLDG